ncbi:MAG: hypothetical protein U5Q44_04930 [Dehalococcoidia bacterium]|nr:hypothetical protein [Dehalococcoidia bacterium]
MCTPQEPYDRFALGDWVAGKRAQGKAPTDEGVVVVVEHPDREADGNCRWCGDSRSDRVEFN